MVGEGIGGRLAILAPVEMDRPFCVSIVTLDQEPGDLERLDFLVIDVYGTDLEVLKGTRDLISRCMPVVIVELSASGEEMLDRVKRLGFCFFIDTEDNFIGQGALPGNLIAPMESIRISLRGDL